MVSEVVFNYFTRSLEAQSMYWTNLWQTHDNEERGKCLDLFATLGVSQENMKTELAALLGTPEDMITITAVRPR